MSSPRQQARELEIVRILARCMPLTNVRVDPGGDPPDAIISSDEGTFPFEVTEAQPEHELRQASAIDAFHDLMGEVAGNLPPVPAAQFTRRFGGTSISVHFEGFPPSKRAARAAKNLLEWLIERPTLRGRHDFATDLPPDYYLANPLTAESAPPISGLQAIFVHDIGPRATKPVFGTVRDLRVWDPQATLAQVVRRKIRHPYAGALDLHLAVAVPDVPSPWGLAKLGDDLGEDLAASNFGSIWLVDRREAVRFR